MDPRSAASLNNASAAAAPLVVARNVRKLTLTVKRAKLEGGWELERRQSESVLTHQRTLPIPSGGEGEGGGASSLISLRVNDRPIRLRRVVEGASVHPQQGGAAAAAATTIDPVKREAAEARRAHRAAMMRHESAPKRVAPSTVVADGGRTRRVQSAIAFRHQLRCRRVTQARGKVFIDADLLGTDDADGRSSKRRREFVFDVYEECSDDDGGDDSGNNDRGGTVVGGGIELRDFSDDDGDDGGGPSWWAPGGGRVDRRSGVRGAADTLSSVRAVAEEWELLDFDDVGGDWVFDEDDDSNADECDYAFDHRFDDEYDSNAEANAAGDYPDEDDDDDDRGGGCESSAFVRAANPFRRYGDDHEAEDALRDADLRGMQTVMPASASRRRVNAIRPNAYNDESGQDDDDDDEEEDEEHPDDADADEWTTAQYALGRGGFAQAGSALDDSDGDEQYPGKARDVADAVGGCPDSDDDDIGACWARRVRRNQREWARFEHDTFGTTGEDDEAEEWRRRFEGIVIRDIEPRRSGHDAGWAYQDVDDDDEFGGADAYRAMARHEATYDSDEMASHAPDDVDDWGVGEYCTATSAVGGGRRPSAEVSVSEN